MPTTPEVALAAIADRQHGCFTLAQALSCGFSRSAIHRNVQSGRWCSSAPRVYRHALAPPTDWRHELCALQLSGRAVATGLSALALHGAVDPPSRHELLVVRSRRNLERVVLHSTKTLPSTDVQRIDGIRATTPARSVLIACDACSPADALQLTSRVVARGLVSTDALRRRALALESSGRPGTGRVLAALDRMHPDTDKVRSEWERLVLDALARFEFPPPLVNHRVRVGGRWRLLDFCWLPTMVDLEFDGYLPHIESRATFDDDRVRQNDLVDAGWRVFRLTSTALQRDPAAALEPIARALGHRVPVFRRSR